MKNTVLSYRLKQLRQEKGYSQQYIADIIGMSRATVSLWETGDREPQSEEIVKLAHLYETTTDWLLGADLPTKRITQKKNTQ